MWLAAIALTGGLLDICCVLLGGSLVVAYPNPPGLAEVLEYRLVPARVLEYR
jgi:hypothetical protein